jgi:ankyrin repeat protein
MQKDRVLQWFILTGTLLLLTACSMTTSPLHSYIKSDQDRDALELIAKGDTVNERDQMGYTPLHLAAIMGNQSIAEALVKKGSHINDRDFHGRTPFMLALREGHVDLAKYFLSQGAQLKTQYTLTNALFDAVTGGSKEMTEYLLAHAFPVTTVNRWNTSALHIAATKGDAGMVALLIRHGSDVNLHDNDGWSALHFAGAQQHREIVRTLLYAGARPTPLASDALSAYATGVVYEEGALKNSRVLPKEAKRDYLTAADHFAKAADFYRELIESTQKSIMEQHWKNAFALALGAFSMSMQPGNPMPTASGGTVRFYTPVIVPQGSVTSLKEALIAYKLAEKEAPALAKRCRNAEATL